MLGVILGIAVGGIAGFAIGFSVADNYYNRTEEYHAVHSAENQLVVAVSETEQEAPAEEPELVISPAPAEVVYEPAEEPRNEGPRIISYEEWRNDYPEDETVSITYIHASRSFIDEDGEPIDVSEFINDKIMYTLAATQANEVYVRDDVHEICIEFTIAEDEDPI